MHQELRWYSVDERVKDVTSKPKWLWALLHNTDKTAPPLLPFRPVHGYNASLEDVGHDWNWAGKREIKYHGAYRDRGVWLLLEWE